MIDKSKIVVGARLMLCGVPEEVVAIHARGEGPHADLWTCTYAVLRPLEVKLHTHPVDTIAMIADEVLP